MKIIKLHVEKFGNLTDLSMDFSDGLNQVLKENGWGKSTLAAFLRVMFYGLEGKGIKKDISENDRTRYMPWDGGAFGGSITFEVKGKSYILSRNYTDKTKGKALLQDAGTLLESNDYSDNIGEELFGIDSDSFKKTAFIDHNNIRYLGANSKIASRVSDLPGMDDLDRFDQVDRLLSEYEVKLSNIRKTGALYKLNEEIHGLENELKKREKTEEELEAAKEEKRKKFSYIDELMKERKALSDKLVSLSEERTVAANYKNYSVVKEECLLREETYFQKKNAFAGDIPSDAEIQECSDILRKAEEKKLQNEILERDIASLKNDINTLEDRKQEGEKALGQKEDALSRMKDKNPFEVYSKSDERDGNNETDEFAEMLDLKISKTSSLFFAAAGIFLLGGVILVLINFIMNRNLLILGGGIVCFIIGLVLFILGSMRKKKEHALILSAERKLAKEREAAAFKKQEKLLNAENDRKLLQTEIKGYEERIAADKEKIRLKIETIEQNSVEIGEIEKNVREFSVKTNGANIELSDYEEIHAFIQKIGISLSELRLAEKEYLAAEEKKQIFLTEHPEYMQFEEGRSVPAEEEIGKEYKLTQERITEINESKEKLNEEIGLLAHQIESLGRDMDYYHALSETLSDKKEEAKESEKNLRKMKLTREYLTKAKNRFVAKYMSPVKDRFDYYMDIMANAGILPEDEYQIDAGLSLQKKELGSYHEIAYQSDGYSDMIGICMRFALLDVMFKQEKPMIIMDDPFINLDANHLEGAKEFLKSVAGEYQILYFTCHEDRM